MSVAAVAGAVIVGGASIAASNRASTNARRSARDATNSSLDLQRALFEQVRDDETVPRLARDAALQNVAGLLGIDLAVPAQERLSDSVNQGLNPLPGVTFRDAPIFVDENGGLFERRGGQMNFLGNPGEGSQIRFGRHFLRDQTGGGVTLQGGQFVSDGGEQINPIIPEQVVSEQPAQTAGSDGLDNFLNSPFVQVPLDRSLEAIDRNLSARGLRSSGNRIQAIGDRVADSLFSGGFLPFLNANLALAGAGQVGANNAANANTNLAGSVANQGNTLAQIALGGGAQRASSFQEAGNLGLLLSNQLFNRGGGGTPASTANLNRVLIANQVNEPLPPGSI